MLLRFDKPNKPENAWAYFCYLKRIKRIESALSNIAGALVIAFVFTLGYYLGQVGF